MPRDYFRLVSLFPRCRRYPRSELFYIASLLLGVFLMNSVPEPSSGGSQAPPSEVVRALKEEIKQLHDKEALLNRLMMAMTLQVRDSSLISGDLKKSLQETTRMGSKTLDVQRVSVWFFDEGRTYIRCADLYDSFSDSHFDGTKLLASEYPSYFEEIDRGKIVAADDAVQDSRTCEFADGYLVPLGITSMMDVPIKVRDKFVGVLCHEHTGPMRAWQPEEKQFALFQSSLVSLALDLGVRMGGTDPLRIRAEE
jgi:hypothetical protein